MIVALAPDDFSRRRVFHLFGGNSDWLVKFFPRRNEHGEVVGFDDDLLISTLMASAAAAGINWHPERHGLDLRPDFPGAVTHSSESADE